MPLARFRRVSRRGLPWCVATAVVLALVVAAGFGMRRLELWPADESCLAAVRSPDGARTAFAFLVTCGGATVASAGEVCVEEGGRRRVVARGYKSDSLQIAWESPTRLRLRSLS